MAWADCGPGGRATRPRDTLSASNAEVEELFAVQIAERELAGFGRATGDSACATQAPGRGNRNGTRSERAVFSGHHLEWRRCRLGTTRESAGGSLARPVADARDR